MMKFKFNISWENFILINIAWLIVLFLIVKNYELNGLYRDIFFALIALTVIIDVKAFVAWRTRKKND